MAAGGSVDRVKEALAAAGHAVDIRAFPEGTRSAADAARAIGCEIAQIAKSMIFRAGERPVLILTSGANRVDVEKVAALLQCDLAPADGNWVRAKTGFAIGGVAPVGHVCDDMMVLIDADLMKLSPVWAAAGSPMHVFKTEADLLRRMTNAQIADIRSA
jgi:prolyl-tRNA editing enzyme YbaK/EbsC (Cys-tRNA(Pro) deacylase)